MHASIPSFAIILDTVVKSTMLLALAWGATLLLKKRSAATQHMVRTFALAALLLLPFSVMLVPAWHINGIPQYPSSRSSTQQTAAQQATFTTSPAIPRELKAVPLKRGTTSTATALVRPRPLFRESKRFTGNVGYNHPRRSRRFLNLCCH
jgi:hypothetical protein